MNHNITDFRHATWLEGSLRGPEQFRELVNQCKALLEPLPGFEVIAVTGLSGLLVAPTVAMELGKYLVVVRKEDEKRHSDFEVEGCRGGYNYVILDDFLQSGNTVCRILTRVGRHTDYRAKCLGVLEYRYSGPNTGTYRTFGELQSSFGRIKRLNANGSDNIPTDL